MYCTTYILDTGFSHLDDKYNLYKIINSLGPELRMRNHCVMPKLPRGLAVRYR